MSCSSLTPPVLVQVEGDGLVLSAEGLSGWVCPPLPAGSRESYAFRMSGDEVFMSTMLLAPSTFVFVANSVDEVVCWVVLLFPSWYTAVELDGAIFCTQSLFDCRDFPHHDDHHS